MMYIGVLTLIIIDYITGFIKALKNKCYKSAIARRGLSHKCQEIGAIVFGGFVDYIIQRCHIPMPVDICALICGYIALMEIGSISENVGVLLPTQVSDILPDNEYEEVSDHDEC